MNAGDIPVALAAVVLALAASALLLAASARGAEPVEGDVGAGAPVCTLRERVIVDVSAPARGYCIVDAATTAGGVQCLFEGCFLDLLGETTSAPGGLRAFPCVVSGNDCRRVPRALAGLTQSLEKALYFASLILVSLVVLSAPVAWLRHRQKALLAASVAAADAAGSASAAGVGPPPTNAAVQRRRATRGIVPGPAAATAPPDAPPPGAHPELEDAPE